MSNQRIEMDSTGKYHIIYNVGRTTNKAGLAQQSLKLKSVTNPSQLTPSVSFNEFVQVRAVTANHFLIKKQHSIQQKSSTSINNNNYNINFDQNNYHEDEDDDTKINNNNNNSNKYDVTIISASELSNVQRHLISLIDRWKGPISLTIFAHNLNDINATLEFISLANACHSLVQKYVKFHLVFPISNEIPHVDLLMASRKKYNEENKLREEQVQMNTQKVSIMCQNFGKSLLLPSVQNIQNLNDKHKMITTRTRSNDSIVITNAKNNNKYKYPINLLRNVARLGVNTEYSFVIDIDLLPSVFLRSRFQEFIKLRNKQTLRRRRRKRNVIAASEFNDDDDDIEKKTVFVVPAFESKNYEMPGTKNELLKLLESYQARPFYFDLCWKCQVHTDYETWQRESPSSRNELGVLYEVLWKDPWEPFYISNNNQVPLYDTRFQNELGFSRLSQLCELHMNGYKFAILNDAFLIHPGFKSLEQSTPSKSTSSYSSSSSSSSASTYYDPDDRNHNLDANRLHFRRFRNEMNVKYPHSSRRCY